MANYFEHNHEDIIYSHIDWSGNAHQLVGKAKISGQSDPNKVLNPVNRQGEPITRSSYGIDAINIDWNGSQLVGAQIDNNNVEINTTGDLLHILNYCIQKINELSEQINNNQNPQPVTNYYWFVGTTVVDGNNYTLVASQVQTIPSSTEITLNNEYLYIVAPKTKTITVLDANTNAVVNMKTYNQDTGTFTNAETFVGDYKIYKSAQDGLGRFIINVN